VGARFSTIVQTGPEAHPASCPSDADPSPPSSAAVKKEYGYTSTPLMGHMAYAEPQCLYKGALYPLLFIEY